MADLEQIYEDGKSWRYFTGEEDETIGVYARCPECGRYLKNGKLLMNSVGRVKLREWICKKHGETQPYFDRGIEFESKENA